MSTNATLKRKRIRKACIPCHQRKRKCDAKYPCEMCTTYDYTCRYTIEETHNVGLTSGVHTVSPGTRGYHGEDSEGSKANASRGTSSHRRSSGPLHPRGGRLRNDEKLLTKRSRIVLARTPSPATVATPEGIFDEHKQHYATASASTVFPHVLGVDLGGVEGPPKTHSLAFNFGIRPEEASAAYGSLGDLITEDDLSFYSSIFFSDLAPVLDVLDPGVYKQRCREYFNTSHGGGASLAFGAVAAGVAALGSFFCSDAHPKEPDMVQYAKAILDDSASMGRPGIDHVVAWGLRMLYLRTTSRPNNAWMASCILMHLCESVGLHNEVNIKKLASLPGAAALGHDQDRVRRIFWVAWAGHNLLSYEYDRSPVSFGDVTCKSIVPMGGTCVDHFVRMVQIIPSPNSPFRLENQPQSPRDELFERLRVLDEIKPAHSFLVMTKADIIFCFYRRIHELNMGVTDDIVQLVIDHGNAAVGTAKELVDRGRLFWNVIGSVFQYACVLLAIDTPTALSNIALVFNALEMFVEVADTRLTREALATAQHLLRLSLAKKRRDVVQLEAVEACFGTLVTEPQSDSAIVPDTGLGIDWDQFLIEPYPSMLGLDIPF